jgi:hypothetical protein
MLEARIRGITPGPGDRTVHGPAPISRRLGDRLVTGAVNANSATAKEMR